VKLSQNRSVRWGEVHWKPDPRDEYANRYRQRTLDWLVKEALLTHHITCNQHCCPCVLGGVMTTLCS
jgi:hypothetical protein